MDPEHYAANAVFASEIAHDHTDKAKTFAEHMQASKLHAVARDLHQKAAQSFSRTKGHAAAAFHAEKSQSHRYSSMAHSILAENLAKEHAQHAVIRGPRGGVYEKSRSGKLHSVGKAGKAVRR